MLEVNKALVEINGTFVIQLLSFLFLVWLMNRWMFRPLSRTMKEREERITGWFEKADLQRNRMEERLAEYDRRLDDRRREIMANQDSLKEETLREAEGVTRDAEEKGSAIVERVSSELAAETERIKDELTREAGPLSRAIAERLLGRPLS